MIRVIGVAIVGAVIGSIATHGNTVGIWAGFLIAGAAAVVPLLNGTSALKCPYCRKRVKLGATVCHHCSRPVGRAAS